MTNKTSVNPDILKNKKAMAKIDTQDVLGSLDALADQIRHAWQDANEQLNFQPAAEIHQVVICGMGGSALGPDVIQHLYKDQLKAPIDIINDYDLPGYVNKNTLIILSSYSGNTEEIVSCAQQAEKNEAQIMAITSGGKIKDIAEENQWPTYVIDPKYNPCQQPRVAVGYAIAGMLALLNTAGVISVKDSALEQGTKAVLTAMNDCQMSVETEQNPAKSLAFMCVDRRPILVGAEFLSGALHVSTNQFNESAKTYADYKLLPEINHHLLEGLEYPKSNKLDTFFIFINSNLYRERLQKRVQLTQQAVEKQGIETLAMALSEETKIGQVFEMLTILAYANFYLAMLYEIDPSEIPMVDWFKAELKKMD